MSSHARPNAQLIDVLNMIASSPDEFLSLPDGDVPPHIQRAIEADLVEHLASGGSFGSENRVALTRAGWAAISVTKPKWIDLILSFFAGVLKPS